MKFSLKLSHKALVLVALPLAFELLFTGLLMFAMSRAEHEIWRERHSRAVMSESNALLKSFLDTGLALYMYGATNSDTAFERYKELRKQVPEQIDRLKVLVRSSTNQAEAYDRIVKIGNRASELLEEGSEIIADRWATRRMAENRQALESLLSNLSADLRSFIKEQEKAEQIDPHAESAARTMIAYCLGFGMTINVVLAFLLVGYFNKGITKRLLVLMDNVNRLGQRLRLHERLGGDDEIADLDDAFHQLAKSVEEARERQAELQAELDLCRTNSIAMSEFSVESGESSESGESGDKLSSTGLERAKTEELEPKNEDGSDDATDSRKSS